MSDPVFEDVLMRNQELRARVRTLEEAVCFFASVIKSGEAWSPTCEASLRRALAPTETEVGDE